MEKYTKQIIFIGAIFAMLFLLSKPFNDLNNRTYLEFNFHNIPISKSEWNTHVQKGPVIINAERANVTFLIKNENLTYRDYLALLFQNNLLSYVLMFCVYFYLAYIFNSKFEKRNAKRLYLFGFVVMLLVPLYTYWTTTFLQDYIMEHIPSNEEFYKSRPNIGNTIITNMLAGICFILAIFYKKALQIKEENDLTI